MLTTAHLLTGAAVGKITGNVFLAIPWLFLLHYILDAIPHWNQKPVLGYKESGFNGAVKADLFIKATEPALGLVLTTYLIFTQNQNIILAMVLGAFFGWFPDLLVFYAGNTDLNSRAQ